MCQINQLKSYSASVTCEKNGTPIDCGRSVAPNITATVKCNTRYIPQPNAQLKFECKENGQWNGERTECKADCGVLVPKADAISAYGKIAVRHEIPWHATIYHKDNQICVGTIISGLFLNFSFLINNYFIKIIFLFLELLIISAAHCFRTDLSIGVAEIVKSEFKVLLGKTHRDINAKEPDSIQTLNINDIQIPNTYHGKEMFYQGDIAFLTVSRAIIYRNHIAPACLNINAASINEKQLPAFGKLGLVAGFGQTIELKPSENLTKIILPYIDQNDCHNSAPDDYKKFLVSDKFCAGYNNNQGYVCKGDSGGGLAFRDDKTEKYYVFGVVSNTRSVGENACDPYFYSLYTSILDYIDTIKELHTDSLLKLRDMIENPESDAKPADSDL